MTFDLDHLLSMTKVNKSNRTDAVYFDPEIEAPAPSDVDLINRAMFVSVIIMLICCFVGFYGNIMSIAIFCHSTMRAPINIILTALSLIDTALIALAIPVFIMPGLNALINSPTLHAMVGWSSLYVYPFSMMTHTCSIWTFVLVSFERYVAVCTPLKRHKLLTCSKAKLVQGAIVVSAIVYNFVRFWEYESVPDTPLQPLLRDNSVYFLYYYVLLYMVTHFLGPFAVILVLNIFVVCSLRAANKDKLRRVSRSERQQRKTTQMIVVITLIFACFTTPPFVINWIEVLYPHLFYGRYATAAFIAMDVSNILVVLNSSSTFLIYLLYCRKYRILFMQHSSRCCPTSAASRKWSDELQLSRKTTAISLAAAGDELGNYAILDRRLRSTFM